MSTNHQRDPRSSPTPDPVAVLAGDRLRGTRISFGPRLPGVLYEVMGHQVGDATEEPGHGPSGRRGGLLKGPPGNGMPKNRRPGR